MPLISYKCSCGKKINKFHRLTQKVPNELDCKCGLKMQKQLGSPGVASVVTIDNGSMARALDVNLESIKSHEEDSIKDFSDYKNTK